MKDGMKDILRNLGIEPGGINPGAYSGSWYGSAEALDVVSPIDGEAVASVAQATPAEYERTVAAAQ